MPKGPEYPQSRQGGGGEPMAFFDVRFEVQVAYSLDKWKGCSLHHSQQNPIPSWKSHHIFWEPSKVVQLQVTSGSLVNR